MNADGLDPSPPDTTSRRARLLRWADVRSVPLRAILVTIAIVVAVVSPGQAAVPTAGRGAPHVGRRVHRSRLEPTGGRAAALEGAATGTRRHHRDALGRPSLCRPGRGLRLSAGQQHHALRQRSAGYVNKAEHGKGWIGHLVRKYHIESWVNKNSPKLVSYAQNLSKPALNLGKGAISVIASLAAVFAFVLLLLLEAPKIRAAILGVMSPDRARRYSAIGGEVSRSISGLRRGGCAHVDRRRHRCLRHACCAWRSRMRCFSASGSPSSTFFPPSAVRSLASRRCCSLLGTP